MRSTLSSGTRVQYTQPPNGSLNGTPSSSTSVRLTPLGPMPRSDTPCAVGCDARLLVRRNRLNVGICRSTSSATTAGDCLMSSWPSTLTLAGTSRRAAFPARGGDGHRFGDPLGPKDELQAGRTGPGADGPGRLCEPGRPDGDDDLDARFDADGEPAVGIRDGLLLVPTGTGDDRGAGDDATHRIPDDPGDCSD